jgi:hypothetical protein
MHDASTSRDTSGDRKIRSPFELEAQAARCSAGPAEVGWDRSRSQPASSSE